MISRADVRRIQELPDNAMVLMAVVNDNPANVDNGGGALQTRVKVAMQEAGVPPTVMKQVLDDLARPRTHHGKSALYVVSGDDESLERFDINADLPERFHYGRPLGSLVAGILDLLPTVAVLAVDREWARFFLLRQGELAEIRRHENVRLDDGERWDTLTSSTRHVPGAPGTGGQGSGPRSDSGTDLFEDREDANQQRFYNRMAAELGELMTRRDINALILVGPVQRVAEFKAEIPDKAPYEVIGETNVTGGAGWVNPAEILDKIGPIVEDHRQKTEAALLDQIQEQGVMEVERVLEMIQEARIYRLVIPGDGSQMNLYRSHNREVPYFTSRKDVTESPLDGSLMERVTLEEVLPDLIDLYGIEVRRVHGDHAERLVREFGGLAGLPRY
ncbi:VLRF1 family aeRF1-type release factor [Deinococcus aestuarii]|uniref:VLRF1 family aeRF1-type release factor n=1 Tax=Deinococcus aestuarii TaxID=2774531 RepID=UPI001C0D8C13|nr:VLRF1 family aeRF1-type release factor [Deinococcus aestuarii]